MKTDTDISNKYCQPNIFLCFYNILFYIFKCANDFMKHATLRLGNFNLQLILNDIGAGGAETCSRHIVDSPGSLVNKMYLFG